MGRYYSRVLYASGLQFKLTIKAFSPPIVQILFQPTAFLPHMFDLLQKKKVSAISDYLLHDTCSDVLFLPLLYVTGFRKTDPNHTFGILRINNLEPMRISSTRLYSYSKFTV